MCRPFNCQTWKWLGGVCDGGGGGDSNDIKSIKVYQGETELLMEDLGPIFAHLLRSFTLKFFFLDQ